MKTPFALVLTAILACAVQGHAERSNYWKEREDDGVLRLKSRVDEKVYSGMETLQEYLTKAESNNLAYFNVLYQSIEDLDSEYKSFNTEIDEWDKMLKNPVYNVSQSTSNNSPKHKKSKQPVQPIVQNGTKLIEERWHKNNSHIIVDQNGTDLSPCRQHHVNSILRIQQTHRNVKDCVTQPLFDVVKNWANFEVDSGLRMKSMQNFVKDSFNCMRDTKLLTRSEVIDCLRQVENDLDDAMTTAVPYFSSMLTHIRRMSSLSDNCSKSILIDQIEEERKYLPRVMNACIVEQMEKKDQLDELCSKPHHHKIRKH